MNDCTAPCQASPGDIVEHDWMPGYKMTVQETRQCETDANRDLPHVAVKIIDPEGNTDWLCSYDVHPAA